jgi:LCP family protein required for cell wall assembly
MGTVTRRMAASGEKPYKVYRGGRNKGKVPLERREREDRGVVRKDGGGPGRIVKKRRRWGWKRIVPLTLGVLLLLLIVWAGLGYARVSRGVSAAHGRLPAGTTDALHPDSGLILSSPTNILLLGTDHSENGQAGRSADQHSDSMLLLRTDPSRHRLIYLSIPRDLRAAIPGNGDQKINAAMQIGGPKLAVETVDQLFGSALQVNHVVVVDFGSFQELIDAVGGIDVNVPEKILSNRFDCPFAASKCSSWQGWRFRKGVQHMDGHRALIYSRVRENRLDPSWTDIQRGQNQQQVMQATMSKLASASTFFRLPFEGSKLLAPIATDLSTWQFAQLGWVKFRASGSNTLHCRLGGSATSIGGGSYIVGTQENFQVIQTVLGNSAPQPPVPGNLYAPGCLVGTQSAKR